MTERLLSSADLDHLSDVEIVTALFLEWNRRLHSNDAARPPLFDRPEVVLAASKDLAGAEREHFAVLLLSTRHTLIRREIISIGSLSASIVHPREVFRPAIRQGAAAIILVHNHPSGDPSPSRDDVALTRRLVRAGALLGIPILDHVIVAREGYHSLREAGVVPGG